MVTGGNRGIGRAIAEGLLAKSGAWRVVITARNEADAQKAVMEIGEACGAEGRVHGVVCDVTDDEAGEVVRAYIEATFDGRLDGLVNNAGVLLEGPTETFATASPSKMRQTYAVNAVGVFAMTRALLPLMIARGYGRVVVVSSRAGQITVPDADIRFYGYRASKAAVNRIAQTFAWELEHSDDPAVQAADIVINCCCPGYIATGMTKSMGEEIARPAEKKPADGAITPVWLATLPAGAPNGGFFAELAPCAW